jgi:hypothetical protein
MDDERHEAAGQRKSQTATEALEDGTGTIVRIRVSHEAPAR